MKGNAMNKKILTITLVLLMAAGNIMSAATFAINKGVNISGWLSQTTLTGTQRAGYFTQQEVNNLAQWGFDHIRLPVAEDQMFVSRTGEKDASTFKLMHNAVEWCRDAGMKVIIDFHTLHSGTAANIWTDEDTQAKFIAEWMDIADEMAKYPDDLVAFELMNEPEAPLADTWNRLAAKVIAAIREKQPGRKLIVGSNNWENVNSFKYLTVPADDPNIILSFHFYIPHPLTHYGAEWTYMNGIDTQLKYPGELISDEDFEALTPEQQNSLKGYRGYYDRAKLKELIRQAVTRAGELGGLQLYCGEFGCYKTDRESKLNWLSDVVSVLNGFGIPYSHWEYKQGFGFCNQAGQLTDNEVLSIITSDGKAEETPEDRSPFYDTFETGSSVWVSQGTSNVTVGITGNPHKDSNNMSDNVLVIDKKAVGWQAVQRQLSPMVCIGYGSDRCRFLNMLVYNPDAAAMRIKLYDENNSEYWLGYIPETGATGWEQQTIDLTECMLNGNDGAFDGNAVKLAIRPEQAGRVYIDDIYMSETAGGNDQTGMATAVTEIRKEHGIYNICGVYMGTSADRLPSGIYIKNRKKFIKL